MMTVFQAFSEFERNLIVQRTKERLKSARARGRVGGCLKQSEKKVQLAMKLYDSKQHSLREIKEMSGVSTTTLYNYLRKSGE